MTGRPRLPERAIRDCQHPNTHHEHGHYLGYILDSCRCDPCTTAHTEYMSRRRRQIAYGRWDPGFVDAQPTRDHVNQLRAAGMGVKSIAAASGVSEGSLNRLLYGEKGRRPSVRIKTTTAAALLGVRINLAPLPDGAKIDGTGTRRRLRALVALGWTQPRLARHLGCTSQHVAYLLHGTEGVTAGTARSVIRLYDQLWATLPTAANRYEASGITRAKANAARAGWAPPLAWDDDTIDDPNAEPAHQLRAIDLDDDLDSAAVQRRLDGDTTVRLTRPERLEVVRRLHALGFSDGQIARAIGAHERQVLRDRQRLDLPTNHPQQHHPKEGTAA